MGSKGLRRLSADDVGVRRTRQRAAILGALGGCVDFVSARELHALLTSSGATIGLTTVYRALHDLECAELVDVVRDDPGGRYYRQRPAAGHRHYLICRCCGLSRPVDAEVVERWAERIATDSGFTDVEHTLELSGICADCLPAASNGEPPCRRPVPGS
ncbi:Fur family ferric uptake transcriptional regulator [Kribbella sp. VKM Ac-2569]|uniref:Fur family transcriptional regulator n=1 Tax=Kribbella sp. VKM Ac-2569 TaxID=2512220 RepID=UPI0010E72EF3|nr:transcriptional repressor [Kribbella sp. VKM Ac-2569]RZT27627.1 Fur family ferric uptake transcriptional regulator [Kribbella sp. VKM Ac-2569]